MKFVFIAAIRKKRFSLIKSVKKVGKNVMIIRIVDFPIWRLMVNETHLKKALINVNSRIIIITRNYIQYNKSQDPN